MQLNTAVWLVSISNLESRRAATAAFLRIPPPVSTHDPTALSHLRRSIRAMIVQVVVDL